MLDALNGGALGSDYESDDSVGYSDLNKNPYYYWCRGHIGKCGGAGGRMVVFFYTYLDRDVPGNGWRSRWRQSAGHVLTRSPDLGEVFSRRKDLFFRLGNVLLTSSHHEHGFLAAYWRLNVRVGLGAQGLDFAA